MKQNKYAEISLAILLTMPVALANPIAVIPVSSYISMGFVVLIILVVVFFLIRGIIRARKNKK